MSLHEQCCTSYVKIGYFSYKWEIQNFQFRKKCTDVNLKSSQFSVENEEAVKFYLKVTEVYSQQDYQEYLSVSLHLDSSPTSEAKVTVNISILNGDKTKKFPPHDATITKTTSVSHAIKLTALKELICNDTLTLLCEGSIILDEYNKYEKSNIVQSQVPKCTALREFGDLLINRKYTDITIYAGNEEIHAHRAILAARSSVFAAMFDSPLAETRENRIHITDIEPKVIEEMLHFIYTGTANVEGMAGALLVAADKYDLGRLKAICAAKLFDTLSTDNAAETLILADRHGEKQLKALTIEFIIRHFKHVINTASYKLIITSYPFLIDEILRRSLSLDKSDSQEIDSERETETD